MALTEPRQRRWKAGDKPVVAGVHFRVLPGRKAPGDLKLQWLTEQGGWTDVPMAAGALLVDFFVENEGVLYPPPAQGGVKYWTYLQTAVTQGWEAADAVLQREKTEKRERQAGLVVLKSQQSETEPNELTADELDSVYRKLGW